MSAADAEDQIARLAGGLHPDDRERFRSRRIGPGSIYRALVPVWRKFFRPTRDDRCTGWYRDRQRYSNDLIEAPAREDGRAYRHLRIAK